MSTTRLYMSMSLDGFVAGPNDGPGNGLGDGGERLHDWVFAGAEPQPGGMPGRPPGVNGEIFDESMATGAVVAGRGTVEPAGLWGGDHHDGVAIFVLSRSLVTDLPGVTVLDDIAEIMAAARCAAGPRDVLVHGAGVARHALAAGVLDELELHVVPVLLGAGRPLLDGLAGPVELDRVRVREGEGGVTHVRYRVRSRAGT